MIPFDPELISPEREDKTNIKPKEESATSKMMPLNGKNKSADMIYV